MDYYETDTGAQSRLDNYFSAIGVALNNKTVEHRSRRARWGCWVAPLRKSVEPIAWDFREADDACFPCFVAVPIRACAPLAGGQCQC